MDPAAERIFARVSRRLLPFLFLCYVVAYLDRVNVGFAKLQMLSALHMSETAYGVGAGIFFIGYFLFEVPSNLILHRVGARVWISRIMITWGLLSCATMFVRTEPQFYALRFALGLAEAGFFPGILYYLTQWFPSAMRARIMALFMTAIAASGIIGGPVSGWILSNMQNVNGWAAWQWLFLLEGIPSVLLGATVIWYLDNDVDSASWLSASEKIVLKTERDRDAGVAPVLSVGATFRDPRVMLLSFIYFSFIIGLYGISFWLPEVIRGMGVRDGQRIGLLSAIPYLIAAISMICVSRISDRLHDRRWHIAACAICGAVGLSAAGFLRGSPVAAMIALSIGTAGVLSVLPLFWTLPTAFLRGASAAAGIAVINSVGNLAGFLSPFMIGAVADATGNTVFGMVAVGCFLLLGAALTTRASGATVAAKPGQQ
jgi:MFS family permease